MSLRQNDHPIRLIFLGSILTVVYLGILQPAGFLTAARLRSQDAFGRCLNAFRPPPPESAELLLVAIDDESQRLLGQKWPWDRRIHADLIQKLATAHPKLIQLDLVFSGASDPASDQALARSLQAGTPVLLASYMDSQGNPVLPNTLFLEAGGWPGLINKPRDSDLTVRRLLAAARVPGRADPVYAIEAVAAAVARGIPSNQIHWDQNRLILGKTEAPLEPPGVLRIHYWAEPRHITTVPYWQVLENQVPPERIRDKIVLVGRIASAAEIHHDVYSTPLGTLPGVLISANGILTLLSGQFLRPVPIPLVFAAGLFFTVSILLITFFLPTAQGVLAALCSIGLGVAASFAGRVFLHGQTESLSVMVLGVGAWSAALLYKYALLAREMLRLHRQVVTDPVSGAYTGRYFRLRLEGELLRRRLGRKPHGLLVVQTHRPVDLLQQTSWEEVRAKFKGVVRILGSLKPGSWVGQVEENQLALLVPGLSDTQTADWGKQAMESFQSFRGRLGLGLACVNSGTACSAGEWIRRAQAAAARSWSKENRELGIYDAKQDGAIQADAPTADSASPGSPYEYVASELEEKNRALEKSLEELRKAHQELEGHFLEVTKSLIMAMDTKDAYTAGHLERVSRYATRLAETLRLSREEVAAIREAALLHDIGKLNLPDAVLHKTGALTPEESEVIRQHLELGAKILDPMKFFRPITTLLYHHHERYDGKGYPHGLTGEFIPPGAQIIGIADSFDAMTTHRGYNKPKTVQEAVVELRAGAGSQFNPAFVKVFADLIEKEGPLLAGHIAP